MSPERRAVLLLIGLAAAGHAARAALVPRDTPPGAITILGARTAHAALARRDSLAQMARPLADGERIDPDRADLQQLGRLPGVGPGLARRILADREQHGPFGSLDGLDRVPGVGAALLARVAPHLAFAGVPAGQPDTGRKAGRRAVSAAPEPGPGRVVVRQRAPKGIISNDPFAAAGALPTAPAAPDGGPAILNAGTVADLDRLPGIGPAKARRIVAFRDTAGPFRTPADLARVPGISLALAQRLWTGAGAP